MDTSADGRAHRASAASPIGSCRFCATPLRHLMVDLGMSPLCESYLTAEQLDQMEPFYPLRAYVCQECFLVQVKEAKLRAFVVPGQRLQTEARLLHDGSGYAVVAGSISSAGRKVADAEITYRVVPFPNETLRTEMMATARRVAVPEELLHG